MLKWTIRIFLSLLVIAIVVWVGGKWVLSFSTAKYDGTVKVSGVQFPVEVTYDEKGIPQIWSKTNSDLYFTVGYLHASERLFQMELVRRFSMGELSEIFGADAYSIDLRQRNLGFARKAKKELADVDEQSLKLLQKYCDGINSWVQNKTILPPEFILLRLTPHIWKPEDCLAILIYQTWFSHSLMDHDKDYDQLISKLGPDIRRILKEYKDWSPSTVPESFLSQIFSEENFPGRMSKASNSWVISPKKSVSGFAIHASDPHLQVNQIPGFWYIMGLHSEEGIHSLGITAAGLPFVAMGHNDSIAWAFTVASVDIIDYYKEKLNPADSTEYLTTRGYEKFNSWSEEIKVKDEENPRIEIFLETDHGVVIEKYSDHVTSLKWAGYDFNSADMLKSILNLSTVLHFDQFRKTVTQLGALDVNWTYSDKNGNIGYQLGTPIPVRNYTNTFELLDGEDSTLDWKGYHLLDETPFVYNPKDGFAATCNNQIVPENWPYDLPGFYDPYRIVRVNQLLNQTAQFSQSSTENMQMDVVSSHATRWKWLMAEGAKKIGKDELSSKINQWNGEMKLDETLPALYSMWWKELAKPIFEDELGTNWKSGREITEEVLTEKLSDIIDDKRTTGQKETVIDISAAALKSVLEFDDNLKWKDVHSLELKHPLSQVRLLDNWLNLNRGPIPVEGDFASINPSYFYYDDETHRFHSGVAASMRYVLDWSDPDAFSIQTNLGQSGNPFSEHYDDMLELWKTGKRWTVPFSREKVYNGKNSLLILEPKN